MGLHLGLVLPNSGALLDPEGLASAALAAEEAGCDGFVVDVGHELPGLEERPQRFAEEVRPLVEAAEGELTG